jgi:hypothetical protein
MIRPAGKPPRSHGSKPPECVPPEDIALLLAARDMAKRGRTVRLKVDHHGELIALEEVMHRAADFKQGGDGR